jgi:hypothetical protein
MPTNATNATNATGETSAAIAPARRAIYPKI